MSDSAASPHIPKLFSVERHRGTSRDTDSILSGCRADREVKRTVKASPPCVNYISHLPSPWRLGAVKGLGGQYRTRWATDAFRLTVPFMALSCIKY